MIDIILRIIVVILQLIAGQLLGFVPAMALGVGDGWELVVIALGYAVGVWIVGGVAAILRRRSSPGHLIMSLLGALIGAFLGVVLILITPAFGFAQLLMALAGALVGYYIASYIYNAGNAS